MFIVQDDKETTTHGIEINIAHGLKIVCIGVVIHSPMNSFLRKGQELYSLMAQVTTVTQWDLL